MGQWALQYPPPRQAGHGWKPPGALRRLQPEFWPWLLGGQTGRQAASSGNVVLFWFSLEQHLGLASGEGCSSPVAW